MNSAEWQGDLSDDCTLERYGMLAHVEAMDTHIWWFGIYSGREIGSKQLYNSAENETAIKLTTGKMARAAAECCMEVLRRQAASPSTAGKESDSIPLHPKALAAVAWNGKPIEPGYYWYEHEVVQVFVRPGHSYLCIAGEPTGMGKRDFVPVAGMSGRWSTLIPPPIAHQDKALVKSGEDGTQLKVDALGLLPCPFCGDSDIQLHGDICYDGRWCVCENCGCTMSEVGVRSDAEAYARWNQRPGPQNAERTTTPSRCTQAGNQTDGGGCKHRELISDGTGHTECALCGKVIRESWPPLPADAGQEGEARTADHSEKPGLTK